MQLIVYIPDYLFAYSLKFLEKSGTGKVVSPFSLNRFNTTAHHRAPLFVVQFNLLSDLTKYTRYMFITIKTQANTKKWIL